MSIARGLVGWWRLDGNLTDSSGNGDNGTANGTITFPAGKYGRAASGAAGNNIVTGQDYRFVQNTHIFTMAAWGYVDSLENNRFLIFTLTSLLSAQKGHFFAVDYRKIVGAPTTNNTFRISIYRGSPGNSESFSIENGAMQGWHFYAATGDGKTLRLYRDGVLISSQAITQPLSTGASEENLNILHPTLGDATDRADNLMIFNRTLSPSEMKTLYALGSPI